jgi:hypothetical protein
VHDQVVGEQEGTRTTAPASLTSMTGAAATLRASTAAGAATETIGTNSHVLPLDGRGDFDGSTVAVRTPVTRRPPHRSVRAELPHTAPALSHDAKRWLGWGWLTRTLGMYLATSGAKRSHVMRVRWLRRRSAESQARHTSARNMPSRFRLPGTAW